MAKKKQAVRQGQQPPPEVSAATQRFPLERFESYLRIPEKQEDLITVPLYAFDAFTANGSGVIAKSYGNSPNAADAWASYVTVYEEFRVLAFRTEYRPTSWIGGSTQTYKGVISGCLDRNDATLLTSNASATRFSSYEIYDPNQPFEAMMAMSGSDDAAFQSTSSPSSNQWIKYYNSGNTASQTVGAVKVTYLVQFRGRGLT